MNYKRNAKYFKAGVKLPWKVNLLLLVGVIILFKVQPIFAIIGLIALVAIWWLVYGGKPSDAEIDAQLNSLMNGLKEQALRKLGLDEEEVKIAPPLFLKSYSLGKSRLQDKTNLKLCDKWGKDGYLRSPECLLSVWFFTEDQIYHYVKTTSLASDSFRENTDEFFYRDVVSVKTDVLEKPWIDPKTGKEHKTKKYRDIIFTLRNSGGETTTDYCDSVEYADECVRAMRNLLKQKKLSQQS